MNMLVATMLPMLPILSQQEGISYRYLYVQFEDSGCWNSYSHTYEQNEVENRKHLL